MPTAVQIRQPSTDLTLAEVLDRRAAHFYHNNFERCYQKYRADIHARVREHIQLIADDFNQFSYRYGHTPRTYKNLMPRVVRETARQMWEHHAGVALGDQAHLWGIHADLVQAVIEWLTEPRA